MKKIAVLACFLIAFTAGFAQDILKRPNPPTLVTDAAGVLLPEQKQTLEQKLVAFDDSTSNQIAVVLIKSLNDYPIEDYAVKLFRDWGIGGSKNNNGVLILISVDDHKIKIETGYGLEGAIPDVIAADIIKNDMAPSFRENNYYRGIDNAVNSLEKAAAGEYHERREKDDDDEPGGFVVFLVIVAIVLFIITRGRGGGRGGGMVSRRGFGSWIVPSILFGGGNWGRGSGGGWSGGFGGFGGGSSGGGGASGGW